MVQWLRWVSGCKEFEVEEGGGAAEALGSKRTLVEGLSGGTHTHTDTSAHARSDEGLSWKYINVHFLP